MMIEMLLRERLEAAFSPSFLEVQNDSSLHAGHNHRARTAGETHFTIVIVSPAFSGVSRLKRHQMVYNLFKKEMADEDGIHALVIKAFAPEETAGEINSQ